MSNTMEMTSDLHDKILKCNGTERAVAAISADILHGKYLYSRKTHKWYILQGDEWKDDVSIMVTMRHDLSKTVSEHFDAMAKRYLALAIKEAHNNKASNKVACRYHSIVEKMDKIKHKLGMKTFNDRVIREMRENMIEPSFS